MAYHFSYDIKGLYHELQKVPEYQLLYNESKLHSTMLYVNEGYKEGSAEISFPNRKTTIKDIEVWGTDHNNFYLVATLNDPGSNLKKTYEQLKEMTGAIDERGANES